MKKYEIPDQQKHASGFWKKHGWWLIPLLVCDVIFLAWWFGADRDRAPDLPTPEPAASHAAPPEPEGIELSFPTPHSDPLHTAPETVFMPTASGRLESATYGSVRTVKKGKYYLPSFHEGIDIAPVERDRRRRPTDTITAAASGRVLYANRVGGRSNYGKYVVLGHDDPLGEIYTLYAHLAEVDDAVVIGSELERGAPLGRMGHTASSGIPLVRAHLHFEIGVINNQNFYGWFKKEKMKPDHKTYHGYNMAGIDPLAAFEWQDNHGRFSMKAFLEQEGAAFTLLTSFSALPDYFSRYPSLWKGDAGYAGPTALRVSEGGVVLSGRPATVDEATSLNGLKYVVADVDEDVLGRNGLRLIRERNGKWVLGSAGERWLEILAYR